MMSLEADVWYLRDFEFIVLIIWIGCPRLTRFLFHRNSMSSQGAVDFVRNRIGKCDGNLSKICEEVRNSVEMKSWEILSKEQLY